MPPTCAKNERRDVERIVAKCLLSLKGEAKGDYYPLAGSQSYVPKPGGMSVVEEEAMRADNFVFQEPDSMVMLSSGMGRHWPDGRGIFLNESKNFLVWANEEDHMRVVSMDMGSDIKSVFERFVMAVNEIEEVAKKDGYGFSHTEHLGYILASPANLGTGLRANMMLKIPLMSARPDFKLICAGMKLQVVAKAGVCDISNSERLGVSEVDLVNTVIEGCAKLVKMEQALESGAPMYAMMPGLGDEPTPGFPWKDTPASMPDLSKHCSIMAEVLRANPTIYDSLKTKKTKKGVTLASCIKTGMDNKGSPTVGLTACDEESYEVFKELFDPVIDICHGGYKPDAMQPTDLDTSKLSPTSIDPTGNYLVGTSISAGRSLKGLRMPPMCSKSERREIERVISKCLLGLEDDFKGDYYPLAHSTSYIPKPGGMSMAEEEAMLAEYLLFDAPDSTVMLASGMGRHWPDGRGVFVNETKSFAIWANEEDHLRIMSRATGSDVKSGFERFVLALNMVEDVIKKDGQAFAYNDHLGYILASPANLGTGLRASAMLKIPLVSARADFKQICAGMKLQALGSAGDVWTISSSGSLGVSEVVLVNAMIEGCAKLVKMEQALATGGAVTEFMPGLGDAPPPGFPAVDAPDVLPDLSQHNSIMAEVLKSKPSIYDSLKSKKTKKGVTLAACIKTGMDNKGLSMVKTVGMVAGDEESFEVFKELFDPVIEICHGGYKPDAKHLTDLDASKLSSTSIDATGKYAIGTRISAGRSLTGLRLSPTIKKGERREVERVLSKALLGLEGDMKGDYYPLALSKSYPPKMGGMSMAEEDALREAMVLFREPDSTVALASGMGRHWPDARGIFASANFAVWCNEEDHARIIALEMTADVKAVFARLATAVKTCGEAVKKEGYEFMYNDHLGYILASPANLGTGLRASVMLKIPCLAARPDLKDLCGGLRLTASGGSGGGVMDVSNSDSLGKSEVELVNLLIEGCAKLVQMEKTLESGGTI
jgi:creatine kinase